MTAIFVSAFTCYVIGGCYTIKYPTETHFTLKSSQMPFAHKTHFSYRVVLHYDDVRVSAMASQITILTIVYLIV